MKKLKMLLLPGAMLGMSAVLCAADAKSEAAPAPEAQAAGNAAIAAMNQVPQQGMPVEEAFAFLPDVVAKIGDQEITKAELIDALKAQLPGGTLPADFPVQMLQGVAPQMVEEYVQNKVLEKAVAASGITVTPAEVEAKFREQLAKMPAEQRAMLEQALASQNQTIDDVIKAQAANPQVAQGMTFEKMLRANNVLVDSVDPAEVQKFYDEHPDQFMEPGDAEGTIRASHILIKVDEGADQKTWDDAKAQIEVIKAEIEKGADFGKLAEEKSDCPSGKQAKGSLGAFGKGQMVPEFESAAFALKEGELSAPVKTQFGYHLIRRDASQKERKLSFDEVKDQLSQALLQQKNGEAVRKFVDKLMADAKVEILVKAPEAPAAPAAK